MDRVTTEQQSHYRDTFLAHGATPRGVDWRDLEKTNRQYENMLAVILQDSQHEIGGQQTLSLLDVGCGYGGLLEHTQTLTARPEAESRKMPTGVSLAYTGIDVVEEMIAHAEEQFPDSTFLHGDIFSLADSQQYDYVVCNGILTQKLTTSIRDMHQHAKSLITKMFSLCSRGIAFNMMSSHVNFMVNNLYYANPVEMLSFCLSEISSRVAMNHVAPLYEFTIYCYRDK